MINYSKNIKIFLPYYFSRRINHEFQRNNALRATNNKKKIMRIYNISRYLNKTMSGEESLASKCSIYTVALSKTADNYVYHGTGEGSFRTIRKSGLRPLNGYLYFSEDETYAESYASRKGNPYGNRVLRVKRRDSMVPDSNMAYKGDLKTKESINPSEIEVKENGTWMPIQEYHDESIGIMPI